MAAQKVICDTDVMIDYFDRKNLRHEETKQVLEDRINLNNIVLSAISKMELAAGASDKSHLSKIEKKLNRFNIALINDEITLMAMALMQKYALSHRMSIPDSIIAATAIINGIELFTYNTKDYKFIPELSLYQHI